MKKVRHLIEASNQPTVVYTDHGSIVQIVKQASLTNSSTDKLNLRLVRASEYLQRFTLDVRHKAGRTNYVLDALSRLAARRESLSAESDSGILDSLVVEGYPITTVELSNGLSRCIHQGYSRINAGRGSRTCSKTTPNWG